MPASGENFPITRIADELQLMSSDLERVERAANGLVERYPQFIDAKIISEFQAIDKLSQSLFALRDFVSALQIESNEIDFSEAIEKVKLMDMKNRLSCGQPLEPADNSGSITLL